MIHAKLVNVIAAPTNNNDNRRAEPRSCRVIVWKQQKKEYTLQWIAGIEEAPGVWRQRQRAARRRQISNEGKSIDRFLRWIFLNYFAVFGIHKTMFAVLH